MRGSSLATTRGVKALDTSLRSLVWSGGSNDRNEGRLVRRVASGPAISDLFRSLLAFGSRNAAEQSACFATTTRAPSSSANGEAWRSPASIGYGSGRVLGSASSASAGRWLVLMRLGLARRLGSGTAMLSRMQPLSAGACRRVLLSAE